MGVILPVDPAHPDAGAIARAAAVIRAGGLVAFPTETVYGLGADGLNAAAVRRVFAAKGRPVDNPLILHIAAPDGWRELAPEAGSTLPPDVRERIGRLAARFWPGPLTMLVPRASRIPLEVTAGLQTVAVRMPDHPVALALIRKAGVPLAGPSANASGRPSPTTAAHVLKDLGDRVDVILDAGPTGVGLESTVVNVLVDPPVILRPGGVTREMLEELLGEVAEGAAGPVPEEGGPAASPGTKYRHYAPSVPLWLAADAGSRGLERLLREGEQLTAAGRKIGALVADEEVPHLPSGWVVRSLGPRDDLSAVAARLFGAMRELEQSGVDVILALPFAEEGLGRAIMNRLRKAASRLLGSEQERRDTVG